MTLPPYASRELIAERLPLIFPAGLTNRNYLIRELAASSVFTFLYIGALEGSETYLGPVHIYRMTEFQATLTENGDRNHYASAVLKKGGQLEGKRWYADNTREPIRDETLREGLVRIGVVTTLDLPTTSSKPRYQIKKAFAGLFDPALTNEGLEAAIHQWQEQHLSKSALTRLKLVRHSSAGGSGKVLIKLPTGETRLLSPGPSSDISKAVIEDFAIRYLQSPMVLWLSTSDDKVVTKDDALAREIGINIEADKNLPDIILVDLAPKNPVLVFIEVVASDGPVSDRRKEAIYELTDAAGFPRNSVTFVTAYLDREAQAFKKTVPAVTWDSFAWFVSEPENLMLFKAGAPYLTYFL